MAMTAQTIPVLDLKDFVGDVATAQTSKVFVQSMGTALCELGFFALISTTGLSSVYINAAYGAAEAFFCPAKRTVKRK